ncbi:MAG: hypothetical protein U9R44_06450 [Candidatus Omnitrophota bacterium]|nr:hypothetical protein [Candidatus Omnitrophota bacterium]
MGKAILFRATVITLSVIGGICFAEGYLIWAVLLWLLGSAILFVAFPLVEGDPVLRRGRLLGVVIPVFFFIMMSGLVLLSRDKMPAWSYLSLLSVLLIYATAVYLLIRTRGKGW